MKLFYRLESATSKSLESSVFNRGAYGSCIAEDLGVHHLGTEDDHPSPMNDPLLRATWAPLEVTGDCAHWYFGFHSLQYLSNWFFLFPDLVQVVHETGIARIGVYEVPDSGFHKGQFQSIANSKCNIKLVEVLSIQDVLDRLAGTQ